MKPGNELEIIDYIQCSMCMDEFGEEVDDRADLDVGVTPVGLQIWCRRHNVNVAHYAFGSNQPDVNVTAARQF